MNEKDKEEIKGYMKELSDDFGKQIGVYVEEVNDKFKATNEVLVGINEKLDSHTKMLQELTKEAPLTRARISDHENRITNLELT